MVGGNGNGMGMGGMGKGNPRGEEGVSYPSRGNEVPIPHKNFANPNTMYGYEVPIPVNRPR